MPDVFNYIDFRKYLADLYREMKAGDPKFSHRYFSMKVGYHSSGFFSEVLTGKKNLTGPVLLRLARALKLGKEEEEYFINLVHFNQARTIDEKNRYYQNLMGVARVKVEVLETGQFEYFSKWYYAAVREVLWVHAFRGDYRALARSLNPSITRAQARRAVKLLAGSGMIAEDASGRWLPTATMVSTGEGFTSLNVANFQRACIDLAREGLDRHARDERDYSTLTLPMNPEDMPRAKAAIARLRQMLMALSDKCRDPQGVYQFNFQLFPVSRR